MRAIQIVELSGPESALKLADIDEPGGDGVVIDVRAAGVSFPEVLQTRGAVPDQAGPAVRARAARWRASCAARRRRRVPRATASPRSACSAASPRSRVAPRALHVRAPDALDFAQGAGADPQLPHGLLRVEARAGGWPRARPCSCTAPRAASAPRRCRWPRGSARGRSRSCPATRRSASRATAGADEVRALRRRLEGRGEGARRRATSCSTRSAATASPTACARCARTAALRRRRLHRRLDPRGQGQPPAAEQHRRRRRGLGRLHRAAGPR